MKSYDAIVIGAGIAGASAAYEIAEDRTVLLLEREDQPGYHTTGRSAALFSETYGNAAIRGLTVGSRDFYEHPPAGFATVPLLTPRGVLLLARADQMERVAAWVSAVQPIVPDVHMIDAAAALAAVPLLRADYAAGGALEPGAMDIDVHALHQGYLRGAKARGVQLVTNADVSGLARDGDGWVVRSSAGTWRGSVVVNAAGAWADAIATLAQTPLCGLTPMRRTAIAVDLPDDVDARRWPAVIDSDEEFYFKPEAGRMLLSLADETPMPPCDVQPDELDIAIAIDRVQQAADLPPVVGLDPAAPGFFWLAGQGGYGFQTAPAMGRLAAALSAGRDVPEDLAALGVQIGALAPGRPGARILQEQTA